MSGPDDHSGPVDAENVQRSKSAAQWARSTAERFIDDDSVYHALIMRWLIAALANRTGFLAGAHPGVEFYRGKHQTGEADIVLLMADGTIIPAEVKRHGRQLIEGEVGKVRSIADALQSPTVLLGAGDSGDDCPQKASVYRSMGVVSRTGFWIG